MNQKHSPTRSACIRVHIMAAAAAVLVPALAAQNYDENVVLLSEFTVNTSKDVGYSAADTLSAGRLSTNLLMTPSNVSVITRELMDDIGATSVYDAATFMTNVRNTNFTANGSQNDYGDQITFRGLPSGRQTRDYFQYGMPMDEYLIDRVEGSRGPNSILYGAGSSGGNLNVLTKRAEFRDFGTLRVRFDTYDTARVALDINRRLSDKVAVRLNVVDSDRQLYLDGARELIKAVDGTVSYRPWKGAEIRGELESGYYMRSNWVPALSDYSNYWDRKTTTSGPLTANPASTTGLTRYTTDYLVETAGGNGSINNMINFAQTSGDGLGILPSGGISLPGAPIVQYLNVPSRRFNIQPSDSLRGGSYNTQSVFYDQSYDCGLITELAYLGFHRNVNGENAIAQSSYIDVNAVLPNGQANPNFKQPYTEYALNGYQRSPYWGNDIRASVAYPVHFGWFKQDFSFIGEFLNNIYQPMASRYSRINNTASPNVSAAANQVYLREYWNNPRQAPLFPTSDANGDQFGWTPSRYTRSWSQERSMQFNTAGSYLDNTLSIVGGLRRDDYHTSTRSATYDQYANQNGLAWSGSRSNVTTGSVGSVYFPVSFAGVFLNLSQGFSPFGSVNPDINGGFTISASHSRSTSEGLRFKLFQGKLIASMGVYQQQEEDLASSFSTSSIDNIWLAMNEPNMEILSGGATSYVDYYNDKGHGFEIDLVANPTKAVRLTANLAFPRNSQSNVYQETRAYYSANVGQWTAFLNSLPTGDSRRTTIQNALNTISSNINSVADGRELNGTYEYTANFFGRYTLDHSWLKGAYIGGGLNYFGKQLIGNPSGLPFNYIYADSRYVVSALAGYSFKLGGRPLDLQLNVSNALNDKKPIYSSVTNTSYGSVPGSFYYANPMQAQITATYHL